MLQWGYKKKEKALLLSFLYSNELTDLLLPLLPSEALLAMLDPYSRDGGPCWDGEHQV
jgi:hypothetical protein